MVFKVGDLVTIQKDLQSGISYDDGCYVNQSMEKYFGKSGEVTKVFRNGSGNTRYKLEIDDNSWTWSNSMLKLKGFTLSDLKSGDVILRRNGSVEIYIEKTKSFITQDGHNLLSDMTEDFKYEDDWEFEYNNDQYDIVAVRRPNQPFECQFSAFSMKLGELVYEEKRKEMSIEEIEKELGYKIKVVDKEPIV